MTDLQVLQARVRDLEKSETTRASTLATATATIQALAERLDRLGGIIESLERRLWMIAVAAGVGGSGVGAVAASGAGLISGGP